MDGLIYQYAVGGSVFGVGLWYAWRQGYFALHGQGLRHLLVMLAGFLALLGLQSWLQYGSMTTLPAVPYTGGPLEESAVLGTPLDYGIMAGYFVAMLVIGTFFGQGQGTTKDFFFGGQRFSWWLIAFSLVATTIGSSSFVKYSRIAYGYGTASSQTYLNDWFWLPLLLFGWLPILYFGRLTSIPEYFEHRFSPLARRLVTAMLLTYLVGYVGINLYTMGKALNILLNVDVFLSAVVVAIISAIYVTTGGQTSVIMTDLFQGVMLLATGLVILALGADRLGGFDVLWEHLPRGHRTAFPNFNEDSGYSSVGIFWQDGMANSAMFYFLNQGILMRFMAARSVQEGRRAAVAVLAILMPIAAVVVASGGWVGQAFVHAGILSPEISGDRVFFEVSAMLARPGVFGLVMAALTAALMSTVDSLITAVSAIVINDVYVPMNPDSTDAQQLRAARFAAVGVTVFGVLLVPFFQNFGSIYDAHGAFTSAVTPPMVVTLLLGVFWRRMTPTAAVATMGIGGGAIFVSLIWPSIITPFAHGVPMDPSKPSYAQYKFMRAFFGLGVSFTVGILVSLVTTARPLDEVRGWVWGTMSDALSRYKGRAGAEVYSSVLQASARSTSAVYEADALPGFVISKDLAQSLEATEGDLVYVQDHRRWLGGLRSRHGRVASVDQTDGTWVGLPDDVFKEVGTNIRIQRMY